MPTRIRADQVQAGDVITFGALPFYVTDCDAISDARCIIRGTHTDTAYWQVAQGYSDAGASSILRASDSITVLGRMPS